MIASDSLQHIMKKAGSLLARRAYSRGELRDKLAALGETQQIESVLDRLQQLNLLNDADYAYNSAGHWLRQEGWGSIKVRHLLSRRKVPDSVIDVVIDRLHQETTDADALQALLDRRFQSRALPQDRKAVQKLISNLQRRGFTHEAILSVLHQRIPQAPWQDIETGD